jgi:serine protease Do
MRFPSTLAIGLLGIVAAAGSLGAEPNNTDLERQIIRDLQPLAASGVVMLSHAQAVRAVRESVVTIEVQRLDEQTDDTSNQGQLVPNFDLPRSSEMSQPKPPSDQPDAGGTGVLMTADGLVLTNHHVVENAKTIRVRLLGRQEPLKAEVTGTDAATDLAVLRIRGQDLKPATFGDSAALEQGDVVLAIGSPFGLEQTVTMGIVSATGRSNVGIIGSGMEDFVQTDAAINPGNSGGPLIDGKGRVVGINTGRYWGESIGFAVPVNLALKVAIDLVEHGAVQRGYLGVRVLDMTPKLATELGLALHTRGVAVDEVEADRPAAIAGILPRDIITRLNDRRVESRARFMLAMAAQKPGNTVTLTLLRQSNTVEVKAVLGAPLEQRPRTATEPWELVPRLKLVDVSRELRRRFKIDKDLQGLVVTEDFSAESSGNTIHAGEVIVAINGAGVLNIEQSKKQFQTPQGRTWMLKVISPTGERFVAVRAVSH